MQETLVRFLGQEDSLEEEMATHSSILTWEIQWTGEPGGLQSMVAKSRTQLSDWTITTTSNILTLMTLLNRDRKLETFWPLIPPSVCWLPESLPHHSIRSVYPLPHCHKCLDHRLLLFVCILTWKHLMSRWKLLQSPPPPLPHTHIQPDIHWLVIIKFKTIYFIAQEMWCGWCHLEFDRTKM